MPLPALDLAVRQIHRIQHWEWQLPSADPVILAIKYSSRRGILYRTTILMLIRGGKPVHFLADWNFRLIGPWSV